MHHEVRESNHRQRGVERQPWRRRGGLIRNIPHTYYMKRHIINPIGIDIGKTGRINQEHITHCFHTIEVLLVCTGCQQTNKPSLIQSASEEYISNRSTTRNRLNPILLFSHTKININSKLCYERQKPLLLMCQSSSPVMIYLSRRVSDMDTSM